MTNPRVGIFLSCQKYRSEKISQCRLPYTILAKMAVRPWPGSRTGSVVGIIGPRQIQRSGERHIPAGAGKADQARVKVARAARLDLTPNLLRVFWTTGRPPLTTLRQYQLVSRSFAGQSRKLALALQRRAVWLLSAGTLKSPSMCSAEKSGTIAPVYIANCFGNRKLDPVHGLGGWGRSSILTRLRWGSLINEEVSGKPRKATLFGVESVSAKTSPPMLRCGGSPDAVCAARRYSGVI